jgi:hypothetical protein
MSMQNVLRVLAVLVVLYVAYLIGTVLVKVALGIVALALAYWAVRRLLVRPA